MHSNLLSSIVLSRKAVKLAAKLAIIAGGLFGATLAHAESVSFSTPFAFSAGGKLYAAGTYTMEASGMTLAMRGASSGFASMIPVTSGISAPSSTLEFTSTPASAVLNKVRMPNGVVYSMLLEKGAATSASLSTAALTLSHR